MASWFLYLENRMYYEWIIIIQSEPNSVSIRLFPSSEQWLAFSIPNRQSCVSNGMSPECHRTFHNCFAHKINRSPCPAVPPLALPTAAFEPLTQSECLPSVFLTNKWASRNTNMRHGEIWPSFSRSENSSPELDRPLVTLHRAWAVQCGNENVAEKTALYPQLYPMEGFPHSLSLKTPVTNTSQAAWAKHVKGLVYS